MGVHGEEAVTRAVQKAVESSSGQRLVGSQTLPRPPALESVPVPDALRGYEIEAGRASDYDWLLQGGVQ